MAITRKNLGGLEHLDTRLYLLLAFLGVAILRAYLLLSVYHDPSVYHTSTRLDVVLHSHFAFGMLEGEFFHYDVNGVDIEYSPVLPVLVGLIAIPLHFFGVPELHATFLSVSILMGLTSLGLLLQLSQYNLSRLAILFIVILNPIDTIGVLPWGGFSMTLSAGLTAFAIYFHRRHQEEEGNRFLWLCIASMMLSASIHRTGLLVQASVLMVLIVGQLANRERRKVRRREWMVIAGCLALLVPLFLGRVLPLIQATPVLAGNGLLEKFGFVFLVLPIRFTLVFAVLCAIGFMIRLRQLSSQTTPLSLRYPSTSRIRLDVIYLCVGLMFYVMPLKDIELSTRFFAFFHGVIYYFFCYSFKMFNRPSIRTRWYNTALVGILVFCGLCISTRNILHHSQSLMIFFRDTLGLA
ncbi:hypothetical protein [Haloferula sp. A504]|uniref:hypothetical protein n=1 Tax=Haloferula sp. A504 TaxID=3373601 RepID=UPI0031BD58EB|nr:hypothetical protein [Verrucomicrobiaceae bacterium E54]